MFLRGRIYRWKPQQILCWFGIHDHARAAHWMSTYGCWWCGKTHWNRRTRAEHAELMAAMRSHLAARREAGS